ncbi:alpha/beta fold hydrolase [Subtercola sp. YIM 133946]|uniref:alpha/beta fold hydrolase n=1 Tax=Subtercola sp. YIM 133946 TaxID=3118909 RepID=UPI002F942A45
MNTSSTPRLALVLHGGGGPFTVASIAAHLDGLRTPDGSPAYRTFAPTLPGWNSTERPESITQVSDLTALYLEFLIANDLRDVLVVGSSLGGWIAADLASRDTEGRIGAIVLIDPVGIEAPGQPIRDFFALDARGVAEYAWHDADRFYVDPATVPPAQQAAQRSNMATMAALTPGGMFDPTLLARLADITVPALVLWGASDRIVTPEYGAVFAAAIPDARLTVIPDAGHLPHLEQPAPTFAALDAFLTP